MTTTPLLTTAEVLATGGAEDLLDVNSDLVAALGSLMHIDELHPDAVTAHFLYVFHSQVANGGFAQFVYNTGWAEPLVENLRAAFVTIGARVHAETFARCEAYIENDMTDEEFDEFQDSELFGDNATRDTLNDLGKPFFDGGEDLVELAGTWLRGRPDLTPVAIDDIEHAIEAIFDALPDRAEREAELADAPRPEFEEIALALAEAAGEEFERMTAGSPSEGGGITWYFLTDKGVRAHRVAEGEAILLNGEDETEMLRISWAG